MLEVTLNELEKLKLDEYNDVEITLAINNVSELSREKIKEYQKQGYKITKIRVFAKENQEYQNVPYDVQTYMHIREKLEELVKGISMDLPEKERFVEVYKRICSAIRYDNQISDPVTKEEKEYCDAQENNSRNLVNGLLYGKCVCAGFADILRNALSMVNIESKYVFGEIYLREIDEESFKKYKAKPDEYYIKIGKRYIIIDAHAWNKVKLDGKWYNVDITYDALDVRLGRNPQNCLKTDREIRLEDRKKCFEGPKCVTKVSEEEIAKLFNPQARYIKNIKIPELKDIKAMLEYTIEDTVDMIGEIRKKFINLKEKVNEFFSRKRTSLLETPNDDGDDSENNSSATTDSKHSWDLENWGMRKEEISKDAISSITQDEEKEENISKDRDNYE